MSTPSSARLRLGLSAKSAITVGIPAGTLAASSRDRYIALNGLLVLATSLRTAPPALPEAPVTSIMVILLWLSNPNPCLTKKNQERLYLILKSALGPRCTLSER